MAILPVDRVPGWLNFLRQFDRLASVEQIETGPPCNHDPLLADTNSMRRRCSHFIRCFLYAPQRRLIHAIRGGHVHAALFDKVKVVPQCERAANALTVVLSDAHETCYAIVCLG